MGLEKKRILHVVRWKKPEVHDGPRLAPVFYKRPVAVRSSTTPSSVKPNPVSRSLTDTAISDLLKKDFRVIPLSAAFGKAETITRRLLFMIREYQANGGRPEAETYVTALNVVGNFSVSLANDVLRHHFESFGTILRPVFARFMEICSSHKSVESAISGLKTLRESGSTPTREDYVNAFKANICSDTNVETLLAMLRSDRMMYNVLRHGSSRHEVVRGCGTVALALKIATDHWDPNNIATKDLISLMQCALYSSDAKGADEIDALRISLGDKVKLKSNPTYFNLYVTILNNAGRHNDAAEAFLRYPNGVRLDDHSYGSALVSLAALCEKKNDEFFNRAEKLFNTWLSQKRGNSKPPQPFSNLMAMYAKLAPHCGSNAVELSNRYKEHVMSHHSSVFDRFYHQALGQKAPHTDVSKKSRSIAVDRAEVAAGTREAQKTFVLEVIEKGAL